jgi:DNA-binding LacI/PurR family transcriptional regulator
MRVSLKDIAEAAGGISVAAVSLALRGSPEVSEATRLRVRLIAEKLGYRPRVDISRLASRRWKNREEGGMKVAFIAHRRHRGGSLIQIVMETARARGFDPEVFMVEDYSGGRQLGNVLWSRGFEALVTTWLYDKAFVEEFPWEKFTGVVVESGYYAPLFDIIYPDVTKCGCDAWQHAVDSGYRRIGFAWFDESVVPIDAADKESAFLLCRERGRSLGIETIERHFSNTKLQADFAEWLDANRLDAVIGQSTGFFYGMEKALQERGIGFASINTLPIDKDITGCVLAFDRLMARAWQEIEFQLRNFQKGFPEVKTRILVALHWNEGKTLPARDIPPTKKKKASRR